MKFEKLIAAVHTPLDEKQNVNFDAIEAQADILTRNKVTGAFVCGSTGEAASLSVSERKLIAEKWMEVAGDKLDIIVHVGHNSVKEACGLAEHSENIGAVSISTNAPCYYKPASVDALVDYCGQIASAAPNLPFYFYHIPSMTGVNLSMVEFLRKGAERIDNLAGLKYTGTNILEFHQCLNLDNGRFEILYGNDEELLLAVALGAKGAVGSTYNYAAPIYYAMLEAFAAGDTQTVCKCEREILNIVSVLYDYGLFAAGKAIMTMFGADCGSPRSPLTGLSKSQFAQMKSRLSKLEIFGEIMAGFEQKVCL